MLAENGDYLNLQTLAEKLIVSKRTVEKWEAARRIPGRVKCGRLIRYSALAIEKALLSGNLLLPEKMIGKREGI